MTKSSPEAIAMRILTLYQKHFSIDPEIYATQKKPLSLPTFSISDLSSLCDYVRALLGSSPIVQYIESPVIIVGDLHGHILDLFRILRIHGLPDKTRYLFLGDIVDRGEFSIETVTLIFALKALFTNNVYIIRGNHEFDVMCSRCGFQKEILQTYKSIELFHSFIEAFNYMPLLAVVNDSIVCVHGGIGPDMFSVNQVNCYERPIEEFTDPTLSALLWSDPHKDAEEFKESTRGCGHFFGEAPLTEFLDLNSKKLMVRAHECVQDGCEFMFNEKIVTVFSASNYCGLVMNQAAVLIIPKGRTEKCQVASYPPLQYLKRECVNFQKLFAPNEAKLAKSHFATSASLICTIRTNAKISRVLRHFPSDVPKEHIQENKSEREIQQSSCPVKRNLFPISSAKSQSIIRFQFPT
ncbi:Ser/Thr protein phosphatase [Tritrichomonas foetus]|uniref:Serine/threonine-protein phosphatase n=1 Tax=Tritrichomonas foetus TaxID=1144522 RepID=A0A1J4KIB5_9EUKA|nr:Ser/Thr protein phosphatase [Tritrichomonas foetus]|eukprot:OHT09061.1 Ser/Thr protein phosphatase [Tritrichomonas foetus]